jgi:hypothetical protein
MGTSSTSIGAFAWMAPPVMTAVWLTTPVPKDARAEAMSIARLFVLLVLLGHASILIAGMHPVHAACIAAAALRLAVLAPLVMVTGLLSRALTARWAARRGGKAAAAIVGQGMPCLVWLPIILLALETHRPQGGLDPEELGITWPHERVALRGTAGAPPRSASPRPRISSEPGTWCSSARVASGSRASCSA